MLSNPWVSMKCPKVILKSAVSPFDRISDWDLDCRWTSSAAEFAGCEATVLFLSKNNLICGDRSERSHR